MKTLIRRLLAVFALFFLLAVFVLPVMAQAMPTDPGVIPQSAAQFWDLAIAAVAPVIIWGISKAVPNVPKVLLPCLTPLVGMGLGYALNQLAGTHMGWYDAAKAGALAVFVREAVNQAVTKRVTADVPVPTPTQGPKPQAPG